MPAYHKHEQVTDTKKSITQYNKEANQVLKKVFESKGITRCENCNGTFALQFAHKWKRIKYRRKLHLLSDFRHVILLCQVCHHNIEYDKDKTKELFERLR